MQTRTNVTDHNNVNNLPNVIFIQLTVYILNFLFIFKAVLKSGGEEIIIKNNFKVNFMYLVQILNKYKS